MNENERTDTVAAGRPVQDRAPRSAVAVDRQRKREEFRTWLFLTFVMAPVLAVLIVSGYGFVVWIWQMIAGPPTYGSF